MNEKGVAKMVHLFLAILDNMLVLSRSKQRNGEQLKDRRSVILGRFSYMVNELDGIR